MSFNLFGSFSSDMGDLNKKVLECKKCPYHMLKSNADNRVNGYGKSANGLMIVGQCPGRNEIESGIPFTGVSGNLLKTIMKEHKIIPSETRFTNIIRCLPPEGKNIIKKAIDNCMTWLDDEIHLIKPKLIVCLGNVAGKAILGTDNVATDGGKLIVSKLYYIDCILTYHTAHLLRLKVNDEEEYNEVMKTVNDHWRKIALLIGVNKSEKDHD